MCNEKYRSAEAFISEFGASEFEPFAMYDEASDCLRIRLADCSVIEKQARNAITIEKRAHGDNEIVGIAVHGVRQLVCGKVLGVR